MKKLCLVLNITLLFLLLGCGLVAPPQEPLSAAFTQPIYRVGEPLEFSVVLINKEDMSRTTTLSLRLGGDYDAGLLSADGNWFAHIWSKTLEVTLEAGEQRTFTYQVPYEVYTVIGDVYSDVGTGHYQLRAEALGRSTVAETFVNSVFDVEVTYPDRLKVGQTFTVQAVLSNGADFDVHDVVVTVTKADTPKQILGRLPAHTSKTLLWMVTIPDDWSEFDPLVVVRSSDGGNTIVDPPSVSITPGSTP